MTFTQVDDALMDSPEFLTVTRSARLLVMEAYTYCNRQLTDGFITRAQWLRSTDTEDFDAELEALLAAGVIVAEGKGYRLDWSKQQTREQVLKARERKRADNDRRVKSLELHKAGDHELCTHEGGGHHKPRRSSGQSSGPSIRQSTGAKRPSDRPLDRPVDVPTSHPIPTHNGVEGGMGGSALDGTDSAGATSTLDAGAAGSPQRSRTARSESAADRWARADAITADLFPEDPEGLSGLMAAASAEGFR